MVRGVVEGFYGRPFVEGRRGVLIRYLSMLDEPAYLYAPKNDPFHRIRWREDYPAERWEPLKAEIRLAADSGVNFIFGISPWGFREGESGILRRKALAALEAGAGGLAVLFDDIPRKVDPELALMQLDLVREALDGIRRRVFLCPSVYCEELLQRYCGEEYLAAWKRNLPDEWTPMWTGRSVISRNLDTDSMDHASGLLGARPAVWDNLLADDYCLRRIFLAGLEGRVPEGHDYFLNPPECFPAALHGVFALLIASGVDCPWPGDLGVLTRAWEVLSEFHHTPWSTGGRAENLLARLRTAQAEGPDETLISELNDIHSLMCLLLDDLEEIPWGWEMAPYARDLKRIIGWWLETLMLPTPSGRTDGLSHLMFRRLPFDHPLAVLTAELAGSSRKGKR